MTAQTTAPAPVRAASRTRFHPLTVTAVEPATADASAVAVTLTVPAALRTAFAFRPGQYLTVRTAVLGDDVRRSYSLCSTPQDLVERGILRIGVRAVDGGTFSSYATRLLAVGDTLEVLAPRAGSRPSSSRRAHAATRRSPPDPASPRSSRSCRACSPPNRAPPSPSSTATAPRPPPCSPRNSPT